MIKYLLQKRLSVPQDQSRLVQKISCPPRLDPQTVQWVTSCYTDYAICTYFSLKYELQNQRSMEIKITVPREEQIRCMSSGQMDYPQDVVEL
jgi:hypothetical protein